jgi:hypothetical protein
MGTTTMKTINSTSTTSIKGVTLISLRRPFRRRGLTPSPKQRRPARCAALLAHRQTRSAEASIAHDLKEPAHWS